MLSFGKTCLGSPIVPDECGTERFLVDRGLMDSPVVQFLKSLSEEVIVVVDRRPDDQLHPGLVVTFFVRGFRVVVRDSPGVEFLDGESRWSVFSLADDFYRWLLLSGMACHAVVRLPSGFLVYCGAQEAEL